MRFVREIKLNGSVYAMFVPVAVLLFLFSYMPMAGVIIAFKDFDFTKGIFGSEWANPIWNNFDYLLTSSQALRAIRNTILLNLLFIAVGLVFEVGLALLLHEIRSKAFKRTAQSITFLPFFISWIVVGVFLYNLLQYDHGAFNELLKWLGADKIDFYNSPGWWPLILVLIMRWKFTGYGTILYLAGLVSIDSSYYEAAAIDGASRWKQIRYISLPMLKPTMIILTLLAIGRILNADFGMFYALVGDAPMLFATTDVVDTFVYRSLRETGDISMASASGFLQSIVAFLLVLGSNAVARKVDRDSALF